MSFIAPWSMALFISTMPARPTSSCGSPSRTCQASARSKATTAGISPRAFCPGSYTLTLRVVTLAPRETRPLTGKRSLIATVGAAVLKVGQRIDTDRIGHPPRLRGQPLDPGPRTPRKYVAAAGREHKRDVVRFGVGVLQNLERYELRVVTVNECPVVGGKGNEPGATT
jgi:hypothetical protein